MRFCPVCKFQLDLERTLPSDKTATVGFIFCKRCNYSNPIPDEAVVLDVSRHVGGELTVSTLDSVAAIYDNFPRKQIPACGNKSCPTAKDSQTEVVVWKDENFNVRYICTTCNNVVKTL